SIMGGTVSPRAMPENAGRRCDFGGWTVFRWLLANGPHSSTIEVRTGRPSMKPPLKLNEIDKEHLQELYDAAGVGREHLPYTPVFEKMCQDFQDRTFKNADPEQVYGALLKYIRSGNHPAPPKAESK